MRWQFWQQATPQKLSENVRKALLVKFPLESDVADRILCLGKKGQFSGRPAYYIRVYDPTLMMGGASPAPTFDGLMKNEGHRRALLFEVRTEKAQDSEQVYLTDRRAA